jgi:hypothetical protein
MDWLEQVFGVSPDAGSGLFESIVALTVAGIGVLLVIKARRAGWLRRTATRIERKVAHRESSLPTTSISED